MTRITPGLCLLLAVGMLVVGLRAFPQGPIQDPIVMPLDGSLTKDITPLSELVKDKKKIVIVFIHGVGEHCPGYAIKINDETMKDHKSPEHPWTAGKTFKALGIEPHDNEAQDNESQNKKKSRSLYTPVYVDRGTLAARVGSENSYGSVFVGSLITSAVPLGKLGGSSVEVYGAEITWSQLTWRMKTKNLNHDLTAVGRTGYSKRLSDADNECAEKARLPEDVFWQRDGTPPPPRVYANRIIKEQILNRSLSDAVLYAGFYNELLQRAVAKGLCDAITMTSSRSKMIRSNEAQCWVYASEMLVTLEKNTSYLFVTHSLGSRILYDVLRNLAQINMYRDGPFGGSEDRAAFGAIKHLVCKSGAVYMMANQLSMLKLATKGTLVDTIANDPQTWYMEYARRILGKTPAQPLAPLSCFPKPLFVAFMDTNDPLSWPIHPSMSYANFDFLTAYVRNTWWRWGFAAPEKAHSGYFENPEIGRLIACGTKGGRLRNCAMGAP